MKKHPSKKLTVAKAAKGACSPSPKVRPKASSGSTDGTPAKPAWIPSATAASESTLRHLVYAAAPQFAQDSSGGGRGGGGGQPEAKIYYEGKAVSGATVDLKVGHLVELSARIDRPEVPSSIQWTISGVVIKDFTATLNSGKVKQLMDADRKRGVVKFCWVEGGVHDASVSVVFPDGAQQASASFDVKRPKATLTVTPGDIQIAEYSATQNPTAGILRFSISFSATKDLEGETCWVQVGESRRVRTYINDSLLRENDSGLDGEFPYPNTDGQGFRTNDNPATTFSKIYKKVVVNDSFKMYWLYRPTKDDVWVPLQRADWFWAVEMMKTGDASWEDWTFTDKRHSGSTNGVETLQHPEWDSHIPKRI